MRRALLPSIAAVALLLAPTLAHADTAIVSSGNQLLSFDTSTPGTIDSQRAITGLNANDLVKGIDYRPATGQLFAFAIAAGSAADFVRTYTINPGTGAATLLAQSTFGASDVPVGMAFDPSIDRIRYVDSTKRNQRHRPDGTATPNDVSLMPTDNPEVVALAYDRSFAGATLTTAFGIDRVGSRLDRIGGVNGYPSATRGLVTPIGSLGVTLAPASDAGFDISPDGRAFAALTTGDSKTRLYSINLGTGAATSIGSIGSGDAAVSSLALVPGTEALPPLPSPTPRDTTRPVGLIDLSSSTLKLKGLLASRTSIPFWASEATKVAAKLVVGKTQVATGSVSIARSQSSKLKLTATAAGKKLLAKSRRKSKAKLTFTLTDAAGNTGKLEQNLTLAP